MKHHDAPQPTIRVVLHDIKTVRDGVAIGVNGVPRVAGDPLELVEPARLDDSATGNGRQRARRTTSGRSATTGSSCTNRSRSASPASSTSRPWKSRAGFALDPAEGVLTEDEPMHIACARSHEDA